MLADRHVALLEASYARGRRVVEFGAGTGMLTAELANVAAGVLAIEADPVLAGELALRLSSKNTEILNADFFRVPDARFAGMEMLVSNVPYALSSKLISWLVAHRLDAVLCLQREFVKRMMARPCGSEYSRLSVVSSLFFDVERVCGVPPSAFYPRPRVWSEVVRVTPRRHAVDAGSGALEVLKLLMAHKNRTLRNAVVASARQLHLSKEGARRMALVLPSSAMRPAKMAPEALLDAAAAIASLQKEYAGS